MALKVKLKEYNLLACLLFALPVLGGQCSIEIFNEKLNGEKIRLNFTSKLKSKAECRKLAQMHRPNFNPDQIKFKQVDYKWKDSLRTAAHFSPKTKRLNHRLTKAKSGRQKGSNRF